MTRNPHPEWGVDPNTTPPTPNEINDTFQPFMCDSWNMRMEKYHPLNYAGFLMVMTIPWDRIHLKHLQQIHSRQSLNVMTPMVVFSRCLVGVFNGDDSHGMVESIKKHPTKTNKSSGTNNHQKSKKNLPVWSPILMGSWIL